LHRRSKATVFPGLGTKVESPLVSVVIASVNGLPCVERCLAALVPQMGERAEALVVDRCGEETRAALRSRFPVVRVIAAEQRALPHMHAQGVRHARGALVAILADRFVPDPGWLAAVEDAHSGGHAVFGGAVENGGGSPLDWAVFLCEYARFMPPLARGPAAQLPGNNAVYGRSVLDCVVDALASGAWDGGLHERIRALGVSLWSEPTLRVTLRKEHRYGAALAQRYHAGRALAAARLAVAPPWKRWAYAGATPLLPPLLLARLAAVVARKGRQRLRLLASLPLLLTLLLSGACGEAVGALLGSGDSLEQLD
jgi:hypothetical protein